MEFLYNSDHDDDVRHILAFLDGFSEDNNITLSIDTIKVESVAKQIKIDFPCKGDLQKASIFKKAAVFIFTFKDYAPVDGLPSDKFDESLVEHQNSFLALLMALDSIYKATIHSEEGDKEVECRLKLSSHSLIDIVDAISKTSHQAGFQLLTLLLEQITYKTNPNCQYKIFEL